MESLTAICDFLQQLAPPHLAAEWDNVGLLLGDRSAEISRMMTCLTVTPASAAEAVDGRAQLIVTHHPLPFRPLQRITSDTTTGRLVWELARAGVAVYSPHTSFDSAAQGINQALAANLGLAQIAPLVPVDDSSPSGASAGPVGTGRMGVLPAGATLGGLAALAKRLFALERLAVVGAADLPARRVGLACGSAGELLSAAIAQQCDVFVTGETNFHTCLEAEARGVGLILLGHYASERFGLELLAEVLQQRFSTTQVWASRTERDPLSWL